MRISLLPLLALACSIPSVGQLIGSCPPSAERRSQGIKELRGVIVDENLAVVPKVKVTLQEPHGKEFRNIGSVEADSEGRFSFEAHRLGRYRFVFVGPVGLCRATVPVNYSQSGFKGIRLTLPVSASDTCPQYCESRLKVEEMTGREGRE